MRTLLERDNARQFSVVGKSEIVEDKSNTSS